MNMEHIVIPLLEKEKLNIFLQKEEIIFRSFYELSFSQRRKLEMSKERNKNVWVEW